MASKGGSFMARNFGLVFGGIWLLVGIPFLLVGIWQWSELGRFDQGAVRAEGKVLTRDIRQASRDNRTSTEYVVRYRFQTPDGQSWEGSSEVDVGLWEAVREQGPVEVEYLPDDPSTNRVAGQSGEQWVVVLVFSLLGGAFTLAGAAIFGFSLRRRLLDSRLRETGQQAFGTVVADEATGMRVNNVRQWRLRYTYLDLYGVQHEGKSGYLSPEEAQQWKEGDQGLVFHDPQAPEKSVWSGERS